MLSRAPKSIALRQIFGVSPGIAIAGAISCIAIGVAGAVTLDRMTQGSPTRVIAQPISTENFALPKTAIVRTASSEMSKPWSAHAAAFPAGDPAPRLAIVIVDDGSDASAALSAMRIDAPITLAISPTADAADKRAAAARRYGREVLLLLPMQSENSFDTTPNPIAIHVPRDELLRRMSWNLAQLDGYVGVMNQFGEATSRDPETMRAVMEVIQSKGLGFIDSRAHENSVGSAVARRMGVPTGDQVVAIDSGSDLADLGAGLAIAKRHAERWGGAIVTIPAERRLISGLQQWIGEQNTEVKLAPVTAVIARMRSGKT